MAQTTARLFSQLKYYGREMDRTGYDLVLLARHKKDHSKLVQSVLAAYGMLAKAFIHTARSLRTQILRGRYKSNPPNKIPLEQLERMFVVARERAELAQSVASRLSRLGGREAKIASQIAEALTVIAKQCAKQLVAEAARLERWTVEWERGIGLRSWLT